MELRELTQPEQKYTYRQSHQLDAQTGCIGYLRGDFGPTENIRVETLALTLLSLFRSFPLILFQSQLCPLRELFGCQCPENVPPFKPGAVTGVQIHTETGRPPAVGTGPKTADAELQLTGCQLILLP